MWRPLAASTAAAIWAIPAALTARQQICPAPCSVNTSEWTSYTSLERLNACNHSILFDFSSHDSLNTPGSAFKVLACTIDDNPDTPSSELRSSISVSPNPEETEPLDLTTVYGDSPSLAQWLEFLLDHVQAYLARISVRANRSLLARLHNISVGIYSGVAIDKTLTAVAIEGLHDQIAEIQRRKSAVVQLCGGGRDVAHTFGVAVDTTGNLATVQRSVKSWAEAHCVESGKTILHARNITVIKRLANRSKSNLSRPHPTGPSCVTEIVVFGDSCTTLADRCGITAYEFMKYNTQEGLCGLLKPGQQDCCSGEALTGDKPVMNEDGSCASYTTTRNDTCLSVADAHGLAESDISLFNKGTTWGWHGCDLIDPGLRICLSEGYPPMPAPRTGAVCGPTMPGTEIPTDGTSLATLNPCPLNACCNIFGGCGVSPDYCVFEDGPTRNPGTAPPGRKGCISNCGMEGLEISDETDVFMKIGYYESFNFDRPCLNLRAAHIDVSEYTHIHWGFATINSTFHIGINDTHHQWADFLALQNVKRIVSFGGWGYSINSATYDVLREAMNPANVDTFIVNIMKFVKENHLDGVDFDWEYPGASEVPSVPLGLLSDGPNYLAFLKKLRKIFPHEKTVSMAAPANYWYLRVFPLEEMSHHLDYIVYMTYDLHGQWDYDNNLAHDWCETGNCLRSHVNLTETQYALAMILKAGVPRNLVAVGVASYGRSFGMSEVGCTRPECTFEGPQTTALPGVCTNTAGVLANAEIEDIIINGEINDCYYDEGSDSNILVYNDTQWVAFMSKSTTRRRIEYYKSLGFVGYANWAIDLAYWSGDDGDPQGNNRI